MTIKCLIFDLDDTLVNDTENRRGAFIYTLKKLNISYTEEYFQQWLEFDSIYWKKQFQTIEVPAEYKKTGEMNAEYLRGMRFPLFFSKAIPYGPLEMQKIFKEGLTQKIVPLPDVINTIKLLSKKYPIYIATNGDSKVGRYKIQQIGLENYIQGIFSSDMTLPAVTKVDLEYYEQLLKFMKSFKANECLMIGDNYRDDILIPNKVGFQTCWLQKTQKNEENIVCNYQIESLKSLLDFL